MGHIKKNIDFDVTKLRCGWETSGGSAGSMLRDFSYPNIPQRLPSSFPSYHHLIKLHLPSLMMVRALPKRPAT